MENISRALILAFGMIMFVIGLSYSMYLINKLTSTSNAMIDLIDTVKYYDNLEIDPTANPIAKRTVSVDTIVSTLYRYYKESYQVKIVCKNGPSDKFVLQVFDTTIEGKIAKAASYQGAAANPEYEKINASIYNDSSNPAYLFQAPWTANIDEFAFSRINFFLNGEKGYINNSLIDYSENSPTFSNPGGFLANYAGEKFTETFVEYQYSGETITVDGALETITGSSKSKNKILILYTQE